VAIGEDEGQGQDSKSDSEILDFDDDDDESVNLLDLFDEDGEGMNIKPRFCIIYKVTSTMRICSYTVSWTLGYNSSFYF